MVKSVAEPSPPEELQLTKPEMFENPLYGSVSAFPKPAPRKEQESPKMLRKEPPPCPDPGIMSPSILLSKAQEAEGSKGTGKPVPPPAPFLSPTPRVRSFTCSTSEGRPQGGDKSQGKPKAPAGSQVPVPVPVPVPVKRPIKPSRSELSQQPLPAQGQRPPLPVKSPAVLHLQHSKSRDYRDNAELPHHSKHRPEDAPLSRTAMQVRSGSGQAGAHAQVCTTGARGCMGVLPSHVGSMLGAPVWAVPAWSEGACVCMRLLEPTRLGTMLWCMWALIHGHVCDRPTLPRSGFRETLPWELQRRKEVKTGFEPSLYPKIPAPTVERLKEGLWVN